MTDREEALNLNCPLGPGNRRYLHAAAACVLPRQQQATQQHTWPISTRFDGNACCFRCWSSRCPRADMAVRKATASNNPGERQRVCACVCECVRTTTHCREEQAQSRPSGPRSGRPAFFVLCVSWAEFFISRCSWLETLPSRFPCLADLGPHPFALSFLHARSVSL